MSVLRAATRVHRAAFRSLFTLPSFLTDTPEQCYREQRILPFSQKQMYDVVSDVNSYRHFIPYCLSSKEIRNLPPEPLDENVVRKEAQLTVGFLAFKESYLSKVTCRPYHSVEAEASSATPLFKKLVTTWTFEPTGTHGRSPTGQSAETAGHDRTIVSIDLTYAFSNPLHATVSSAFFHQVSKLMVNAFEQRCIELYGINSK